MKINRPQNPNEIKSSEAIFLKTRTALGIKMANANGILKPTILTVIFNEYDKGIKLMSAQFIRERCKTHSPTVNWDMRIPSICNAMRSVVVDCGTVISEDIDAIQFTIQLN
jgi:hypothetical protein